MGWPNDEAVKRAASAWGEFEIADEHTPTWPEPLAKVMLTAAGLPELVGSTDTAKILGVESSNLSRVGSLPDPIYGPGLDPPRYVRAGNFYDAEEIRALAARRKAAA